MYALIHFLTIYIESQFFMVSGAPFQIFAASFMQVEVIIFPPWASLRLLVTADLVLCSWLLSFLLKYLVVKHFTRTSTNAKKCNRTNWTFSNNKMIQGYNVTEIWRTAKIKPCAFSTHQFYTKTKLCAVLASCLSQ